MNARNVFVVYRKELMDMLRDRRTLFGMFLFPLILFPIMTVGFGSFMEKMVKKVKAESVSVMLIGAEHAPELARKIRGAEGVEIVPATENFQQLINDKKLRAAVEFPADFGNVARPDGKASAVKIYFYRTEPRSGTAADRLEEVVREYREGIVTARLALQGLPAAMVKPVETKEENVANAEKVAGNKLGLIIPYMIIVLCLTGAMHPAMDLTAGEKERGTLETILASSVRRGELVMGKFLLVLTVSLTTAIFSLASFAMSTALSKDYQQQLTRGHAHTVSMQTIGAVFLLVLPLAVLFSGVLLAVSLFAKNYKEAQGYTGPLLMLAFLPAIAGMLPGVDLNNTLALVPILNVSLVSKEVFTGNFPWGQIALVFASTCVYAGAALYAAFTMFQREDVLFRA